MEPTLSIGVMATNVNDKYRDQIQACLDTWYQVAEQWRVPVYFFGGYIRFPHSNYINLPGVAEDYNSAFYKQFHGLKWMYDHLKTDFYHLIGTDTYVNIPLLIKLLRKCDKTKDWCIGGHGHYRQMGDRNVYFHSGGSGFVFSHSCLGKLLALLPEILEDWEAICVARNVSYLIPACDATIGWYMENLGLEQQIRPGFYACDYLGREFKQRPCCPRVDKDKIVACHYMYPTEMHDFHNYLKSGLLPASNEAAKTWTLATAYYKERGNRDLLNRAEKMIIFTDDYYYVWQYRRDKGFLNITFIVTLSEGEWPLANAADKIHNSLATGVSVPDHLDKIVHHLLLLLARPYLMKRALELDIFETGYFAWVDNTIASMEKLDQMLALYPKDLTLCKNKQGQVTFQIWAAVKTEMWTVVMAMQNTCQQIIEKDLVLSEAEMFAGVADSIELLD